MQTNKEKTCKNCEDRHPACHDRCEFFQKRRRTIEEINNTRRKEQEHKAWVGQLASAAKKKH